MAKADRKTGWVSTPDGKNVPFAPTQDTPPKDIDSGDMDVQNSKDENVPGLTDSD